MSTLLASFCNQLSSPRHCLAWLDWQAETVRWLDIGFDAEIGGATGLLETDACFWVLFQGQPSRIAAYDRTTFRLLSLHAFAHVRDAHSLCRRGDHLFVTSTGTNEVYRLDLDGPRVIAETPYWRSPQARSTDHDEVHVNSIACTGERLIVTCFGPRDGTAWGMNGGCYDLESGEGLLTGVAHPHNGGMDGDTIYICESMTGRMVFSDGTRVALGCYPRGVCAADSYLFVASSARRIRSRSSGAIVVPEDGSWDHSALFVLDRASRTILKRWELTEYGLELYDVLAPAASLALTHDERHPAGSRIREIERRFYSYWDLHEDVASQLREAALTREALLARAEAAEGRALASEQQTDALQGQLTRQADEHAAVQAALTQRLEAAERHAVDLEERLAHSDREAAAASQSVARLENALRAAQAECAALRDEACAAQASLAHLDGLIGEIERSRAWWLLSLWRRLRHDMPRDPVGTLRQLRKGARIGVRDASNAPASQSNGHHATGQSDRLLQP